MTEKITAENDIIIMGASTRAAAFSALRAGFHPYCLDLFGDDDTRAHARVRRVPDYPDGLIELLNSLPRSRVVYTGGLENRPDLLELAARQHDLWGNSEAAVRRVRDPEALKEAARLSRLHVPMSCPEDDPPPLDGTWLLRPRGGSGGRGISLWTESQQNSATLQEPHLFQEKVDGVPYSAVFIASSEPGDVRFVGITRQLVGEAACNAGAYQWCGNIGPVALPVAIENLIRRFGNVLKWKMGLLGLYGVDFILTPEGVPWVTEINPRYPASVELLEHATGRALFADHCRCFTTEELPESSWNRAHPGEFMGKAVYYSSRELTIETPLAKAAEVSYLEFPKITDLPEPGVQIQPGEPVCTLFAESFSADQTRQLLNERLIDFASRLQS